MTTPKTILITGASGLVGESLCAALMARGHSVRTLSRSDQGDHQWDVAAGQLDSRALDGVDSVIHLAGESVAQRWTDAVKARILDSRVDSTRLLVDSILAQKKRPTYIAASGIQDTLKSNHRMGLQLRNLDRLNEGDRSVIAKAADEIRSVSACHTPPKT